MALDTLIHPQIIQSLNEDICNLFQHIFLLNNYKDENQTVADLLLISDEFYNNALSYLAIPNTQIPQKPLLAIKDENSQGDMSYNNIKVHPLNGESLLAGKSFL